MSSTERTLRTVLIVQVIIAVLFGTYIVGNVGGETPAVAVQSDAGGTASTGTTGTTPTTSGTSTSGTGTSPSTSGPSSVPTTLSLIHI